jgi:hypothetical protein
MLSIDLFGSYSNFFLSFLFLGFDLKALLLLGSTLPREPHRQFFFALVFLE